MFNVQLHGRGFRMTNKKQVLTLSYISFISFILIGTLTTFLLMNGTQFNLISDSLTCLNVISIAVTLLTTITHALNCHYSDSYQLQVQIVPIIKCVLFMLLFCTLFHITTILFGAPLIEKSAETFHFAVLMTVLVALPCCLASGPGLENWLDIYTAQRGANIETVVHFSTLGALIGGWFGAVPIPLDWDRPWQAWPITCSVGAISGYCGGLLLASLYLPHKFQQLNKSKRS